MLFKLIKPLSGESGFIFINQKVKEQEATSKDDFGGTFFSLGPSSRRLNSLRLILVKKRVL